jgi:DNA polymerase III delta prime subunit
MLTNSNEFLWVEKYRPQILDDCILPEGLLKTFKSIVESAEMQNMLLTGTAGLGKTTVARAMCNMLDLDYMIINGSEESGIDVLRTKIRQFASSVSLHSRGPKVIILDEADYLNPSSTQPALRGFIEEFSNNCRFILTCNFKNRVIEPLHSRCAVIEFNTSKKQMASLANAFLKRLEFILKSEGIQYEQAVVAELILRFAPDWRRVLNECQRYSVSGKIDKGILANLSDANITLLIKALKEKDFKAGRAWVVNNIDSEPAAIFRKIYDNMTEHANPDSIPNIVVILANYQYKDAFVADHELNLVACITELMACAEWKQ